MPTAWTIWKKWVKFLVTYNLPKLNQEKKNLTKLLTTNETELIIIF